MDLPTVLTVTTKTVAECQYADPDDSRAFILGVLKSALVTLSASDPAANEAMCRLLQAIDEKMGRGNPGQQAWNELQATPSYAERWRDHTTLETDAASAVRLCRECQTWEPAMNADQAAFWQRMEEVEPESDLEECDDPNLVGRDDVIPDWQCKSFDF